MQEITIKVEHFLGTENGWRSSIREGNEAIRYVIEIMIDRKNKEYSRELALFLEMQRGAQILFHKCSSEGFCYRWRMTNRDFYVMDFSELIIEIPEIQRCLECELHRIDENEELVYDLEFESMSEPNYQGDRCINNSYLAALNQIIPTIFLENTGMVANNEFIGKLKGVKIGNQSILDYATMKNRVRRLITMYGYTYNKDKLLNLKSIEDINHLSTDVMPLLINRRKNEPKNRCALTQFGYEPLEYLNYEESGSKFYERLLGNYGYTEQIESFGNLQYKVWEEKSGYINTWGNDRSNETNKGSSLAPKIKLFFGKNQENENKVFDANCYAMDDKGLYLASGSSIYFKGAIDERWFRHIRSEILSIESGIVTDIFIVQKYIFVTVAKKGDSYSYHREGDYDDYIEHGYNISRWMEVYNLENKKKIATWNDVKLIQSIKLKQNQDTTYSADIKYITMGNYLSILPTASYTETETDKMVKILKTAKTVNVGWNDYSLSRLSL